jgi:hypothetical protein
MPNSLSTIKLSSKPCSLHAQKRCVERYGNALENDKAAKAVIDILSGRAVHILPGETNNTVVFAVLLDGKAVPVVYDKKRRSIVTVLPRKAILNMLTKRIYQLQENI